MLQLAVNSGTLLGTQHSEDQVSRHYVGNYIFCHIVLVQDFQHSLQHWNTKNSYSQVADVLFYLLYLPEADI